MKHEISDSTLRRLDIQGMDQVSRDHLAEVAPWLGFAFTLCATLAGIGTALASTVILWILVPIAALAATFPVHPFDLLYDHVIRSFTKTRPLPKRRAPSRFACGLATVWLLVTIWAFQSGNTTLGYVLGFSLTAVGLLVGLTNICIPSIIFRSIFGWPPKRKAGLGEEVAPE